MGFRVCAHLLFHCVHFGNPRPPSKESKGVRLNQHENAVGCTMFLHYKWDALNRCWYMHNSNLKHYNDPETKEHFC